MVEHGIDDAIDAAQLRPLEHVLGHGVAVERADAHRRIEPVFGGVQVSRVVARDGVDAGKSGQDGLAPAAVAPEVMQHHGARRDDAVAIVRALVQRHRRAPRRDADGREHGLVARVVVEGARFEAVEYRRAENPGLLGGRRRAVRASRENKANIFFADAGIGEIGEQCGKEQLDGGIAEGIGDDDGHGLARVQRSGQGRIKADGRLEGRAQGRIDVGQRGRGGDVERAQRRAPGQFRFERFMPVR